MVTIPAPTRASEEWPDADFDLPEGADIAPPPASDPQSMENLQLIPLGQDMQRKRYWVIDGPCTFFFHLSYLRVFAIRHEVSDNSSGTLRARPLYEICY